MANADAAQNMDGFRPVEEIGGQADAGVLFLCDHACADLPAEYGTLGLPASDFSRHIAFDIGAADVTRALAAHFSAPAVLACYSRLLIDPNRGADDPTLVMKISDGSIIPGNRNADAAEVERRKAAYWQPYRDAVAGRIAAMRASGNIPAIIAIHSFTESWKGVPRPWQIGLLWDSDPRLAEALVAELDREPDLMVGDNEPYDGALIGYTTYDFGMLSGLPHVLIELRQDLIATPESAVHWAKRLSGPLATALARPDMHKVQFFESRAGRGERRSLRRGGTGPA